MEGLKHRLILRQIRKHLSEDELEAMNVDFLHAIDDAYQDFDKDHYALENLLEQNNKELFKFNARLNQVNQELEEKVKERTLQLEEQSESLKEVNKKLDQFARVVSHDLRSPLNAVESLIHVIELEDVRKNPEDLENCLKLITNRVTYMRNLINGILEYSKTAKTEFKAERVDLNILIQEMIENLKIESDWDVEIQPEFPVLTTDKVSLQQVFLNLVSNALKYNKAQNPKIEIKHKKISEDQFEFAVKDNGNGITAQEQEHIFEVFYKSKQLNEQESTGLGLSIVKQIVEANGSKIRVKSEPGKGSEFIFGWRAKS